MIHFIDTTCLIDGHQFDFPFTEEEEHNFWEWFVHLASKGVVKLPEAVMKESLDEIMQRWMKENVAVL